MLSQQPYQAEAQTSALAESQRAAAARGRPARLARHAVPVLLLLLTDAVALAAAFYTAWFVRYRLGLGGDLLEAQFVEFALLVPFQLLLVGGGLALLALQGLYRWPCWSSWFEQTIRGFMGTGLAVMLTFTVGAFLQNDLPQLVPHSRLIYAYTWLLATLYLAFGRLGLQNVFAQLNLRGVLTENVLVVGDTLLGRMVMQSLTRQPNLGLQVVGFLAEERERPFGRFPWLGTPRDLPETVRRYTVDQVIIALPSAAHDATLEIVDRCRRAGVAFRVIPDLYQMRLSQVELATVMGIPLIGMRTGPIQGLNLVIKRGMDVAIAGLGLLLLAPLFGLIALLIKLDSPGPVFYRQVRVGRGGQHFKMLKFRSMRPDADQLLAELRDYNEVDGPIFKMKNDPRVTRVGRVLRRTSLDELPQLWNVLRGDMSLVGPRPPLPSEVEEYEDWHRRRFEVAPGITGLWQVSGRSGVKHFDERVMLDLFYIENWSLALDLQILLRTLPAVIRAEGAY